MKFFRPFLTSFLILKPVRHSNFNIALPKKTSYHLSPKTAHLPQKPPNERLGAVISIVKLVNFCKQFLIEKVSMWVFRLQNWFEQLTLKKNRILKKIKETKKKTRILKKVQHPKEKVQDPKKNDRILKKLQDLKKVQDPKEITES